MKIYYCYSYPLKVFLMENGERMLAASVHPKTFKKFWMFERTAELDALLTQWSTERPKKYKTIR